MKIAWIAVDWGTSNLRINAIGNDGKVLASKNSDQGMGTLKQADFEPVLLSHIEEWLTDASMPVLACGMVGSRQGWAETPYSRVPTKPGGETLRVNSSDPRLEVHIVHGVCQNEPADVMRGEETQILGFLSQRQDFNGVICLPGTHSKWVDIRDGMIKSFRTAMTGELFALIRDKSVLRFSPGNWNDQVFHEVLAETFTDPAQAAMKLFSIRARNLLHADNSGIARLSGILIGAELAAAKSSWQGRDTIIIGEDKLAGLYAAALKQLGGSPETIPANTLTQEGLQQVYNNLYRT